MKEQIITTAGTVWQCLGEDKEIEVTKLAKRVKQDDAIVMQSLGWLAREDKIMYQDRSGKECVSLTGGEQAIFEKIANNIKNAPAPKKKTTKKAKAA